MAIYLGDDQITTIKLGSTDVLSVCLGDNLVWSETSPGGIFALKYENVGSNPQPLKLLKTGSPATISLEYSTDGGSTWTAWNVPTDEIVVAAGGSALIRATSVNSSFSTSDADYWKFNGNGNGRFSGPVAALFAKNKEDVPPIPNYGAYRLFTGETYGDNQGTVSLEGIKYVNAYGFKRAFGTGDLYGNVAVSNIENDISVLDYGLDHAFQNAPYGSDTLTLSGVIISGGGFYGTFEGNPNLRSVHLSIEDVKYPHGNGGPLENTFSRCSALEDVEISCNPQEMSFTNGYEMIGMFQYCPNLRSVVVRGLSSVGNGYGVLQAAFQNCNSISSVSFPDLVKPYGQGYNGRYAFYQAFKNVSSMTELRFGAGSEDDVKRLMGWDTTFNMTQYGQEHCSVWCGSHMIKPYDSWERDALSDAAVRFIGTKSGAAAKISRQGSNWTIDDPSLETSEDGQSWNPYTIGNEIQLSAGQVVYMRASQRNDKFSQDMSRYFTVELSDADFGGSLKNLITPLSDDVVKLPNYSFC